MKKITSFTVDHDILEKGMYISRIDGDVVTYDIRMKKPNQGDYLDMAAAHTFEHLFATYARNSQWSDAVLYVGPMGCRTGFYLLVRDSLSHADSLKLVKESFQFIRDYSGTIPGTEPKECGNYRDHDPAKARAIAIDMLDVLDTWTTEEMIYES